jgi:hypothetical protein
MAVKNALKSDLLFIGAPNNNTLAFPLSVVPMREFRDFKRYKILEFIDGKWKATQWATETFQKYFGEY